MHELVFADFSRSRERASQEELAVIDRLATLIAASVRTDAWSVDDPQMLATFLFYGEHGVVGHMIASGGKDRVALVEALARVYFRLLGIGQ